MTPVGRAKLLLAFWWVMLALGVLGALAFVWLSVTRPDWSILITTVVWLSAMPFAWRQLQATRETLRLRQMETIKANNHATGP